LFNLVEFTLANASISASIQGFQNFSFHQHPDKKTRPVAGEKRGRKVIGKRLKIGAENH